MAYALPEAWVWDFWVVDDGSRYHLFFLYASRALHDPEARHFRASIGHAVSDDLTSWERVEDALVRGDGPAFDDLATWTGCTLQGPDGTWFTFYTGATLTPAGNVQSIGLATSDDLLTWHKQGQVLEADPRWYEKLSDGQWHDEAFRDPFVYRDGDQWRMLITARANHGPADDRGVIGTAVSSDLRSWTLEPPLSEPGQGFGQLEVMEVVSLEGREHLVFNCLASDLSDAHRSTGTTGGVWITPTTSGPRPWVPSEATLLTGHDLYVGRVVKHRGTDDAVFMAFENFGPDGEFGGRITDPVPVRVEGGTVTLVREALVTTA